MRSRLFMASDTVSTNSDDEADLTLSWSGRWTLGHRILAVNVLTVVLLAISVLYLDSYRNRLSKERTRQTRIEARTTAQALALVPAARWPELLAAISKASGSRMRVYGKDGKLLVDSWRITGPTYELRDPNAQKWTKNVARGLDRGFNALVGARSLDDFAEPAVDRLKAWPEALDAKRSGQTETKVRNAPDLTPVISAAVPVADNVLLITDNDRAFTRTIRDQRATLAGEDRSNRAGARRRTLPGGSSNRTERGGCAGNRRHGLLRGTRRHQAGKLRAGSHHLRQRARPRGPRRSGSHRLRQAT